MSPIVNTFKLTKKAEKLSAKLGHLIEHNIMTGPLSVSSNSSQNKNFKTIKQIRADLLLEMAHPDVAAVYENRSSSDTVSRSVTDLLGRRGISQLPPIK